MRLVDSDVLIWNWRGQVGAATLLAAEAFALSAVSYMELVQGMRNARELKHLQSDLRLWRTTLLPITEAISQRATRLVEQHYWPQVGEFGWPPGPSSVEPKRTNRSVAEHPICDREARRYTLRFTE